MLEILSSLILYMSSPVKIAIIDSGFNKSSLYDINLCPEGHADFTGESSYVDGIPVDFVGHGTAMAMIAHQYAIGLPVPESRDDMPLTKKQQEVLDLLKDKKDHRFCIVVIKALGQNGKGGVLNINSAIKYAVSLKVDIINMSFGAIGKSSIQEDAVKYALDQGVILNAAAGNENRLIEQKGQTPALDDPRVNVVGGYYDAEKNNFSPLFFDKTDKNVIYETEEYYANNFNKTSRSNYGPSVKVWMPGWNILTPCKDPNEICDGVGTSHATAAYTGYTARKLIEMKENSLKFLNKR